MSEKITFDIARIQYFSEIKKITRVSFGIHNNENLLFEFYPNFHTVTVNKIVTTRDFKQQIESIECITVDEDDIDIEAFAKNYVSKNVTLTVFNEDFSVLKEVSLNE